MINSEKELSIRVTERFIYICPQMEYWKMIDDPRVTATYLDLKQPECVYGQAILSNFQSSSLVSLDEFSRIYAESNTDYANLVKSMLERFGYKNKNALFKSMAYCTAMLAGKDIVFMPWHHEKLEAWGPTSRGQADYISIAADSPPEKIGEAMWQALRRCTGRRPAILDQIPEA